jgi:hypothetical protein
VKSVFFVEERNSILVRCAIFISRDVNEFKEVKEVRIFLANILDFIKFPIRLGIMGILGMMGIMS